MSDIIVEKAAPKIWHDDVMFAMADADDRRGNSGFLDRNMVLNPGVKKFL